MMYGGGAYGSLPYGSRRWTETGVVPITIVSGKPGVVLSTVSQTAVLEQQESRVTLGSKQAPAILGTRPDRVILDSADGPEDVLL